MDNELSDENHNDKVYFSFELFLVSDYAYAQHEINDSDAPLAESSLHAR